MAATVLLTANPLPLALVTCLDGLGYEVVTAEDGRGTLEHLGRHMPDLLILDADTLMASGLGTCHRLRCLPEYSDLPIVLTSTLSDLRERSAAHLMNAKVVLNRPLAGEVAAVVEGLLGSARVRDTVQEVEDARLWRTAS